MNTRKLTVGSAIGLHARPASLFVQAVARTGAAVQLAKVGGEPVDARSILLVLGLDVRGGDEVVLSSESAPAIDALAELLAGDLDAAAA